MKKKSTDTYIKSIKDRLIKLGAKKILLFGSYAADDVNIDEDSDIDLLVVLDEDYLPASYDEWLERKMKVRRALRDINNEVAIDLLVYTIPQYDIITKNMNSFQKEIHETGTVLYEKAS